MSKPKQFATFFLAATSAITVFAETRCPGNVESLTYRQLNRHQIVVSVGINHSGPYNFLLDTGTQITMVDSALAGELRLAGSGEASVRSAGVQASASLAEVGLIEAGAHQVAGLKVVVFDLGIQQGKSHDVRGILGEDFLEHFDLLIDTAHKMVCLDDSGMMRSGVKGRRVELLSPTAEAGAAAPKPPVVSVRLSDGMRPVLLELDSGADVCLLFNSSVVALGVSKGMSLRGNGASAEVRTFRTVPPQDVKIGPVAIANVPFISFSGEQKDWHASAFDGLLSWGLFKSVFISHAQKYVVLEP